MTNERLENLWRIDARNNARIRRLAVAMEFHLDDEVIQAKLQMGLAIAVDRALEIEAALRVLLAATTDD